MDMWRRNKLVLRWFILQGQSREVSPEDGDIDQLIRRRREVSEAALRYEPPEDGVRQRVYTSYNPVQIT